MIIDNVALLKYHDTGSDSLSGKRHFHDNELEILHIISGDGVMMIKDKIYSLEGNMLFFICGRDAHCSSPRNSAQYIRNKLVISENALVALCRTIGCDGVLEGLFMSGNGAIMLSPEGSMLVDEYFLKMKEAVTEKSEYAAIQLASSILSVLFASVKSDKKVTAIKNKMSEIIDYINRNYSDKLSLDYISSKMRVSKYYLCHTFKGVVGMTFGEYITFTRISRAKQLLRESENSISDIALSVGFDSFAYFSKVFREYEGISPKMYRKMSERLEKSWNQSENT